PEARPPLPPRPPEPGRLGPEGHVGPRPPRPPLDPIQDFEVSVRRELGPMMEMVKDLGGPPIQERLQQARRAFEERRFEEGRDMLRMVGRQLRELHELRERDPKRFKLQREIAELDHYSALLGQKVRRAPNEEAGKQAAAELREVLNKLFDLRQEEREMNVRQIEGELKQLRESLEQRKARRDEIIKHRFDQLTGKAQMLDW
ncbi:MAG: hypothetical protein N2689_07585, partial [Verrucomicrobiae bacterium]|nr:hypothetical protein [Verrucomicrobiae bacterium]